MRRLISLRWRQARWALVAAVLPVLWACNTQPLKAPQAIPGASVKQYFLQKLNNQVDILFVVDNSPSMETVQTHLAARFPDFINVLKGLPNGMPDVHIGVVSTDLGTGQVTSGVPGCSKQPYGDQGALQSSAGWTYTWDATANKFTTARKTCTPPTGKFISATGGIGTEGTTNYTGTMTDVFSCIASIGATGCGFEHVLGSMQRALGVDPWFPAPTDNDGFVRTDAYLAVIIITNEDDCSVPPDSILFDPNSRNLSGEYGPLASYRCNAFGHKCDGKPAPMRPTDPQFGGQNTYAPAACESLEDGTLLRVSDIINQVKTVKNSSDMIFAAALAGPPAPYVVGLDSTLPAASGYSGELWPKIQPSCTVQGGATVDGPAGTADPGVRIKQFIDGMGGVFDSICASDFGAALKNIATALGAKLGKQCLAAKLLDKDQDAATGVPGTAFAQADCQVVDRQRNDAGQWVETVLNECDDPSGAAATNMPCWYVATDADCTTATKQVIKVARTDQNTLSGGANIAVGCVTCLNTTAPGCDY